jgi:hypothetical protein
LVEPNPVGVGQGRFRVLPVVDVTVIGPEDVHLVEDRFEVYCDTFGAFGQRHHKAGYRRLDAAKVQVCHGVCAVGVRYQDAVVAGRHVANYRQLPASA